MEPVDRMSFDGSCDPNPGGTMGWAYIITYHDGRCVQKHDERPPSSQNTVNIAEYSGLVTGLRAYVSAGGRGPLHITGDSQLIINQVNGVYKVRNASLQPYHREVTLLLADISDVQITWNAREHNVAADQLATTMPPASAVPAGPALVVADELQAQLPAEVRAAVATLNNQESPSFKQFVALRTGGLDVVSRLSRTALEQRAGTPAVALITTALADAKAQTNALRWVLRGLEVHRAIRKVNVDAEMSANVQRRR